MPFPINLRATGKAFKLDTNQATFTPGMAKRLPPAGPFAAPPVIQGPYSSDGAGDIVTITGATTVVPGFGTHIDYNQGSVIFLITPEWAGNDGLNHVVFRSNYMYITKSSTNNLSFFLPTSSLASLSVSVSSWVAGTTYCVVARWDCDNTLDGTNIGCVSINDVHTFGSTSTVTAQAVSSLYFGTNSTDDRKVNAIIQGLTFVRYPVFDGTYGVNKGDGDVIARCYNSGTFVDPAEILHPEDICLAVPTNATVGALATGTGEAWSNPWASNVLPASQWTMTDGFYGGGPAVYLPNNSGYINCGSDAGLDNLTAGDMTVDFWMRSDPDATANPIYLISKFLTTGSVGWQVAEYSGLLNVTIGASTTDATSRGGPGVLRSGKWNHIAVQYSATGDRKIYIWINGIALTSYGAQVAGVGTPDDDSSYSLVIGGRHGPPAQSLFAGAFGWVRVSNSLRYTAGVDFKPSRTPPVVDANTVAQWNMSEGSGGSVDNAEGTAARDGTITSGTWQRNWLDVGTPLVDDTALVFNGTTSSVDCGTDASIDDLHDAAMTFEAWICSASQGEGSSGRICDKTGGGTSGWVVTMSGGLNTQISCATTSSVANYTNAALYSDNKWHHIALTFDDAGDRKARAFVDGVLVATGVAGVGAVVTDAANTLYIGNRSAGDRTFSGKIGWCRLSNVVRYTANFVPPARTSPPAADANTIGQWNMTDGAGTTVANTGAGTCTGTATACTWSNSRSLDQCVGHKVYQGFQFGVDAADEGITIPLTGLTAGTDYVIFPVVSAESVESQPAITIVDDTNAATVLDWHGPDQTAENVVNGTFDSDTGSWTAQNSATLSNEAGGVSGNCLLVTNGTYAQAGRGYQEIQLVPYAKYSINWFSKKGTGNAAIAVGSTATGTDLYSPASNTSTDWTESRGTFVTTGTGLAYVRCGPSVNTTGYTAYFDSISVKRVIDVKNPWSEHACFELPTNARDGAAADCTAISAQITNVKDIGVLHPQQLLMYPNLIDDGGMEKNVANGADVGTPTTSERSNTYAHSGTYSWKIVGDAAGEGRSFTITTTSGKFYMVSGYVYNASGGVDLRCTPRQKSASAASISVSAATGAWERMSAVIRATGSTSVFSFECHAAGTFYIDDVAAFEMTDVSLTVTPASSANSVESGGKRVDGTDTLVQPTSKISLGKGTIQWNCIPRHSAADSCKFGSATPVMMEAYGDADNYIYVEWSAANTIRLRYKAAGGVEQSTTYNATGAIVAGTVYTYKLSWNGGYMVLKLNGAPVCSITAANVFSVALANVYAGSNHSGLQQYDAVYY